MEYEQLENGNKVLSRSILTQDVGAFYELLHPDALLVTHFPYPDAATGSETAAMAVLSPALRLARSDALGGRAPRQRAQQLLREQAALRAAQEAKYQAYLRARAEAAGSGAAAIRHRTSDAVPGTDGSATEEATSPDTIASGVARKQPTEGKAKTKVAPRRSAVPAAAAAPRLQTLLQSRREHRGIVFYFHQPEPVGSMRSGPVGSSGEPWSGGAAASPAHRAGGGGSSAKAEGHATSAVAAAGPSGGTTAAMVTPHSATNLATVADAGGSHAPPHHRLNSEHSLEAAVAAEYGDFVDVTEGRLLICERFCLLLNWVNRGCYVAPIESQLEPRKGVLQDAEVLPAPPPPQTPQEAYAQMGRMHTERNQQVSRLCLCWGREHLVFCDQVFFDDGLITCIHRRMLTLPEMLLRFPASEQAWTQAQKVEKIREELKDFYGVTRSRVAAVSHALPLLDFSFVEIGADVSRLLAADVAPVTGQRHVCRTEHPDTDPHLAQGVFLNADNDPTKSQEPARTLIKAKNKRGEEEAYEFQNNTRQRYHVFGADVTADDDTDDLGDFDGRPGGLRASGNAGQGGGGGRRAFMYDATSLRISGCQLCMPTTSAEHGGKPSHNGSHAWMGGGQVAGGDGNASRKPIRFVSIVRSLVANAMLTLRTVDLSDNHLSVLPDLGLLPLQKLMLHGNDISDWDEVTSKVCTLPYLTAVSLFGNPIADSDPNYRAVALSHLINSPHRKVPLKQLDFVAITGQDLNLLSVRRCVDK